MLKIERIAFATLLLGLAATLCAAQAEAPVRPVGVILKVDAAARRIVMRTDSGPELDVTLGSSATVLRVPPGEKNLSHAASIGIGDLAQGDRILVRGSVATDQKSMEATSVIVMTKSDLATKEAAEKADWERRGVSGVITALDANSKAVTVSVRSLGQPAKTVVVTTGNATLRRYAPDSVKFADARPAGFADLRIGDQVRARGQKSPDGSQVAAEELVSGSFRNIAAIVKSIDPQQNTLVITDLDTKKTVLVRANPDSALRRLPPMAAQMIAYRLHGGAGVGPRRPMANGDAAGQLAQSERRPPGGGAPEMQRMLERIPPLRLDELKPGDALIIASTVGAKPDEVTAITLLAGVEPILTTPADRQMMGSWNFNMNMNLHSRFIQRVEGSLMHVARTLGVCLLVGLTAAVLAAQQPGTLLKGVVTDPSGAAIPGATVTATGPGGTVRVATTGVDGRYQIGGLLPGKYTVRAMAKGFALFESKGLNVSGAATLDIQLLVALEKQQVTVSDQAHVDVDPSENAGALVLKGNDLDVLSDNPDDLASDLQALAGPSAGPNGGQIYIDGFTGGRLPPKESIREVRINQNPFSAEYDRLGFGRIEILTKPGSDRYRGQAFLDFGDSIFNARNPFSLTRPPCQQKLFGGNFGGPLGKKASFFIDAEHRDIQEVSVVNALTLDPSFKIIPFTDTLLNPTTRTTISPRIDYQLSPNHTLVGRYTWAQMDRNNEGVGVFSLPSRAYDLSNTEHTVQLTETAVVNTRMVNETRFQYIRRRNDQAGLSFAPTIQVLEAFTGGGSNIGQAFTNEDHYELQNYTTLTANRHLLKFGVRVRGVTETDRSTQNYNGTFTFTSLDAYRATVQGLANGLPLDQIRQMGGGPSQFSVTAGNPIASVGQFDGGAFIQDDWRVRPNFSLSVGLRLETQNHIHDHADLAPRIGFAWGIGRGAAGRPPKTVLRGGFGMFYDRFSEDLTLQAIRLNGVTQQQFVVPFPDFYPTFPDPSVLAGPSPAGHTAHRPVPAGALRGANGHRAGASTAAQHDGVGDIHGHARRPHAALAQHQCAAAGLLRSGHTGQRSAALR